MEDREIPETTRTVCLAGPTLAPALAVPLQAILEADQQGHLQVIQVDRVVPLQAFQGEARAVPLQVIPGVDRAVPLQVLVEARVVHLQVIQGEDPAVHLQVLVEVECKYHRRKRPKNCRRPSTKRFAFTTSRQSRTAFIGTACGS